MRFIKYSLGKCLERIRIDTYWLEAHWWRDHYGEGDFLDSLASFENAVLGELIIFLSESPDAL